MVCRCIAKFKWAQRIVRLNKHRIAFLCDFVCKGATMLLVSKHAVGCCSHVFAKLQCLHIYKFLGPQQKHIVNVATEQYVAVTKHALCCYYLSHDYSSSVQHTHTSELYKRADTFDHNATLSWLTSMCMSSFTITTSSYIYQNKHVLIVTTKWQVISFTKKYWSYTRATNSYHK